LRYKSLPPSVRYASPSDDRDPVLPSPAPPSPRRLRDVLATIPIVLLLPALLLPFLGASAAVGGTLIASPAELAVLPTSGSAWTYLKGVADGPLGTADLTDQDDKHAVHTLAVALVGNRLGSDAYRSRAHAAIMSAVGTERVGADNSILALGRQLGAYVLAADLIGLSGPDDATFRSWLSAIRTRELGGHGRYTSLKGTCEDSPHNWGTFACASLIAANRYLGDSAAIARSWAVFRGLTGDRAAYAAFQDLSSDAWACPGKAFTPANDLCPDDPVRYGAFVKDVTRGADPPTADGSGLSYTLEILQGVALQAELLARAGYTSAWERLRPEFAWASRNGAINLSSVGYHVTWWANERLGTRMPTVPAGMGRIFGFTDWLYGSPTSGTVPTPVATATPRSTPAPDPTQAPEPRPDPTATPVAAPAGATATPQPTDTPAPTGTPEPTVAPTPDPTAEAAPPQATGTLGSYRDAGPSVISTSTGSNATGRTLEMPRPAGVASGDLLVAALSVRGKPAIDPPAGWRLVRLDRNGTVVGLATFTKVATGDEPATYTWGFDKSQAAAGVIVAVRDGSSGSLADGGQTNSKSAWINAPSVRADHRGSLVLTAFAAATVTRITAPDEMTALESAGSTGGRYRTTLLVAAASLEEGDVPATRARASSVSANAAQVLVIP
jgi:hypothetical protein